ncbi:TonB-dependent receptor [Pseudoalteromonas sp. T1lg65]|uniref:TonB-dependent receptor n=1 Tax=Pseudoalteromonas sp. T1lg65 TaxID=2077101 RepID=UPI003F79A903
MKLNYILLFLPVALSTSANESEIEVITTTASRITQTNQTIPLSISQLNEAQLEAIGVTHIEKALRLVAGANVQHGNGQEYLPALRSPVLTGAGACGGLLTAEDGIPLRAAGFCNINELFESHFEVAQRIEVLKGPGSVMYGSNAVHGVVNVITPDTISDEQRAALDLGSYGYRRAKYQSGSEAHGIGVALSVTDDRGYRNDESVKQHKISLRHHADNEWATITNGLTFTHLEQHTAGYITGKDSYKDRDLAKQNDNPEAYRNATSLRAWSEVSWLADDSTKVLIKPYVRYQKMDFLKHFLPGQPIEENNQRGMGFQSLMSHAFADSWLVRGGFDGEYTQGEMLQYQPNPTQGSAFLQQTIPQGKHYDYQVNAWQLAPFVSVNWRSGPWNAEIGGRFESMKYDYTNAMLAGRLKEDGSACGMGGCRYHRPPSGKDSFSYFSPKVAISYQWNEDLLFYGNISQGYRAPQTSELYQLQRAQSKAELEEEQAKNIELGIKLERDSLQLQGAIYQMQKEQVILRDSDFFYINDGRSVHKGMELELDYKLTAAWHIAMAYSHAKHSYDFDRVLSQINIRGNAMDTAPRNVANIALKWQPTSTLTTQLNWHALSRYFTDPENQHQYSGHTLLSAHVKWQLDPKLALTFRVKNLLDERYAERADYTSFSGDRYFPGKPRNVLLSVDYQW